MSLNRYIVAAAIRVESTGVVYAIPRPGRHHNVIRMVAAAGHELPINEGSPAYTFGFVSNAGLFLDRAEAEAVAREHGQLARPNIGGPMTSEDLW